MGLSSVPLYCMLIFSLIMCVCVHANLLQSCLTLCDPMDCSLPGSSVHGAMKLILLGWPKSLFGFFITSYRKTQMNFLANLMILPPTL